jgi:hypothetical protein
MLGSNATCYLRFPFLVENPLELTRWRLKMRYDDGFVAWLNGEEIVRRNAPDVLDWNSTATTQRSSTEALAFEEFNLAEFTGSIVSGTNILAVQGLNVSAADTDFLIQPSIEASSITNTTNALVYFTAPTPGRENIVGVSVLGPILTDVAHAPQVPLGDQDVLVTATVSPAFAPVTNVTLHYRIMFSNEVAVTMYDDGAHGDGAPGDQVFAAIIPASASTNGEMIRYYVTAADNLGRTSRVPIFNSPSDADEYLGTIVQNPALDTVLPVFHWFVANPVAAETATGTRCSIFYNGELYDNVFVRIRGGTSRSWPKKSYKIELNEDHEFELHPGQRRVTEFDLNTTYTDKSYVRSVLTYEHQRDAGLPSPETFLAHLRQNTAFYNVCLYSEQPDKDFLRRVGLDETGALYKCGPGSTYENIASFEKKTRLLEGTADVQALVAGLALNGAALEAFVFDNLDVPAMVNFMALVVTTQNIDASDKNHFLYRDSEGTREWRMLPWDQDLTFGPDALNTDNIVYNSQNTNAPTCASHPFIGARPFLLHAGKYNRLLEAIIKTPRTREMLLRRTRTLTDRFLTTGYFQRRIDELVAAIGPDVLLDQARWGANAAFPGTTYSLAQANDRIKNEYLAPRLLYLAGTNIVAVGAANPNTQPPQTTVGIASFEFNPASGNQAEEYICLTNPLPSAVDVSEWRIDGAIRFTFAPGTVIPSNSVLYLTPEVVAFRSRSSGPGGGQGLQVQGNYRGQLSARGDGVGLYDDAGRLVHTNGYAGSPSVAQQYLRITEIMYHPASTGGTEGAEELEFIELRNISSQQSIELSNVRFVRGVEYNFSAGAVRSLAPGARVLVVKNEAAFGARYGSGLNVAGAYAGQLENRGERLELVDGSGEEILDFSYDNRWYGLSDGLGFSLVVVDEQAPPEAWGERSQWRLSGQLGGSPGGAEGEAVAIGPILINEALTRTDQPPPTDSIELFNPTDQEVDLGGWFLSDDFNSPKKYRMEPGRRIGPHGYAVFSEADFNAGGAGFALSSDGDEVWLFSGDESTNLTGYVHGFRFGAAEDGVSFGRYRTSVGEEHFVAQSAQSLGGVNAGPKVGPVVISEICYRPVDLAGGVDNSGEEFIELVNISSGPVALDDEPGSTNRWKISGGIGFEFASNTVVGPGEYVLVVKFDPMTNTAANASFRAKYGVGPGVKLFGPYEGKLDNSSEVVELRKPTTAVAGVVPYVVVDEVEYGDSTPWPEAADGSGASLQRVDVGAYGNDPLNWIAGVPTAGRARSVGGQAPVITSQPASQRVIATSTAQVSVVASGSEPLHYQWRRNGANVSGATNAVLTLSNVQAAQGGAYAVLVYNAAGSTLSSNGTLSVVYGAFVFQQPANVPLRGSTNSADYGSTTNDATFSVLAVGTGALSYQWRFNGVDLQGQTNSSLRVLNVGLEQDGFYDCRISDDIGPVLSQPGRLTVLLSPTLVQGPVDQSVVSNGTFTASVIIKGNPPPFRYEWREVSAGKGTNITSQTSNYFTSGPITNLTPRTWRLVIFNAANPAPGLLSQFSVTALADSDRDGLPDVYEQVVGLNPNDMADGLGDKDGDGMSNREEYVAGTDATDANSKLRIEQGIVPGSAWVQLTAVSNRTYSVQYTEELGDGRWSKLADLVARRTNHVELIADPNWTPRRFYRAVTPAQP